MWHTDTKLGALDASRKIDLAFNVHNYSTHTFHLTQKNGEPHVEHQIHKAKPGSI